MQRHIKQATSQSFCSRPVRTPSAATGRATSAHGIMLCSREIMIFWRRCCSITEIWCPRPETKPSPAVLWSRVDRFRYRIYDYDCKILNQLQQFGCGHKLLGPRGNTLLHLCRHYEAECMLEYGGWPINQRNSHGYTILMVIVRFQDVSLVRKVIDRGAMVGVVDKRGCNALHHLNDSIDNKIDTIVTSDSWLNSVETAAMLLASGISMKQVDSCRCPCSPSGCTPLTYLFASCHGRRPQLRNLSALPWFLDWLFPLFWARLEDISLCAEALYRRQRFDELEMTHTCCARSRTKFDLVGGNGRWISPRENWQSFWLRQNDDGVWEEGSDNTWTMNDSSGEAREEESDRKELWDEEKFLAQALQQDYDKFSVAVDTDAKAA